MAVLVQGDVHVRVRRRGGKTACAAWFHTMFVGAAGDGEDGGGARLRLVLRRDELDNASKDRAGKRFAEGFALALDFEPADDGDAPPASGGVLAWIADGHGPDAPPPPREPGSPRADSDADREDEDDLADAWGESDDEDEPKVSFIVDDSIADWGGGLCTALVKPFFS